MSVFESLVLEREAMMAGQWWRVWTGHLAHTGPTHLFGNLAALTMLLGWARSRHLLRPCLLYAALAAPLISISLLAMLPWLEWYAGLSGLLHSLLALLLIRLGTGPALIGFGLLAKKIILESQGLWPGGQGDYAVIWQAHALGAVSALLLMALAKAGASLRATPTSSSQRSRPTLR